MPTFNLNFELLACQTFDLAVRARISMMDLGMNVKKSLNHRACFECFLFLDGFIYTYKRLEPDRLIHKLLSQDPQKKKKARYMVRQKFEERYKTGKNRWFFQKLRF